MQKTYIIFYAYMNNMPSVNIYISEERYVKLVQLALKQNKKTREIVQKVVNDYLESIEI